MENHLGTEPEGMMKRLASVLLSGLLLISCAGCQSHLPKVWSFSELRDHAEKIDSEFHALHLDIKDIFFGLHDEKLETWAIYRD